MALLLFHFVEFHQILEEPQAPVSEVEILGWSTGCFIALLLDLTAGVIWGNDVGHNCSTRYLSV